MVMVVVMQAVQWMSRLGCVACVCASVVVGVVVGVDVGDERARYVLDAVLGLGQQDDPLLLDRARLGKRRQDRILERVAARHEYRLATQRGQLLLLGLGEEERRRYRMLFATDAAAAATDAADATAADAAERLHLGVRLVGPVAGLLGLGARVHAALAELGEELHDDVVAARRLGLLARLAALAALGQLLLLLDVRKLAKYDLCATNNNN